MTEVGQNGVPDWLDVSRETFDRLVQFCDLVRKWTPSINLVSKTDVADLWQRHLLDSAQLYAMAPAEATLWADLGSGGGFPGIVIAIIASQHNPAITVHLVEADRRKAVFLAQAIRQFKLSAVLHVNRIDRVPPLAADVISARGLAPLPLLCGHLQRHCALSGVALFPKGEAVAAELQSCEGLWQMQVERHPSRTRPGGVILKIRGVQHV